MRCYMLKFFLLFVSLQRVLSVSDEFEELARMVHESCVEETAVDEALIDKVNREKVFADDEKLKCYINCLMLQTACISDDGIIDPEATIEVLPEDYKEIAAPVIRACGTIIGANPCENAWLTHKCYMEKNPQAYTLV